MSYSFRKKTIDRNIKRENLFTKEFVLNRDVSKTIPLLDRAFRTFSTEWHKHDLFSWSSFNALASSGVIVDDFPLTTVPEFKMWDLFLMIDSYGIATYLSFDRVFTAVWEPLELVMCYFVVRHRKLISSWCERLTPSLLSEVYLDRRRLGWFHAGDRNIYSYFDTIDLFLLVWSSWKRCLFILVKSSCKRWLFPILGRIFQDMFDHQTDSIPVERMCMCILRSVTTIKFYERWEPLEHSSEWVVDIL